MRVFSLAACCLSLVAAFDARDDEQRVLGLQTAQPPAPTAPPEAWLVRWKLEPRQSSNEGTCGFINGNSANPVTCSSGYVCAHNTENLVFGCCSGDLNTCTLPTVCFDSTLAQLISASANGFTQVCAKASAPFCTTYIADSVYAFGCGSQSAGFVLVYDTATGAAGGSAVVAGGVTTGFQPTGSGAAAVTNGGFTASGSGSAATATAAVAGGGTSNGDTSSGSTSSGTSNSSGGGSVLSTGAIVAIAVCGGVVVIALIILIAFLVHRRGKRKERQQVAGAYQSVPPGPPPGPVGPGTYDGSTQVGTTSHAGSSVPMTQANMIGMHSNPAGEWDFTKNAVHQPQTTATHDADGIKVTEILPEEAVDERAQEMRSQVGSHVAPTAIAPTIISHHVQGV